MASAQAIPLFTGRTSTGACASREAPGPGATIHANVTGIGAVTATVVIQVSNIQDQNSWLDLGTLSLSGTTTATQGLALDAHWVYIRANITTLTGTGATVNVVMGSRDDD